MNAKVKQLVFFIKYTCKITVVLSIFFRNRCISLSSLYRLPSLTVHEERLALGKYKVERRWKKIEITTVRIKSLSRLRFLIEINICL